MKRGYAQSNRANGPLSTVRRTALTFDLISDAEPMLRVLLVQVVGVRGHDFLCVAQEKVPNHMAASVPSLLDTPRDVHFGPIPAR